MAVVKENAVEIRAARSTEFSAIADLLETVFVGEGFVPAWARERIRRAEAFAAAGTLLVAVGANSQVQGVVLFLDRGAEFAEIAKEDECEFRLLAVAPGLRARGLGEQLIEACLIRARAAGRKRLVLSTQPTMHAAQRLYVRLGFTRTPERDWVHANGSPRLAYTLTF